MACQPSVMCVGLGSSPTGTKLAEVLQPSWDFGGREGFKGPSGCPSHRTEGAEFGPVWKPGGLPTPPPPPSRTLETLGYLLVFVSRERPFTFRAIFL